MFLETPQVNCGPETIEVTAKTIENFEGVFYIKNQRRNRNCFKEYEWFGTNSTKNPSYSISLKELTNCGIELKKNVNF